MLITARRNAAFFRYLCSAVRTPPPRSPGKPWTLAEDARLRKMVRTVVNDDGRPLWAEIARSFQGRTNQAVRLRWELSLAPKLNRGKWSGSERDDLARAVAEADDARDYVGIARSLTIPRSSTQVRERLLENVRDGRLWTEEEDRMLREAVARLGRKWSEIAREIPGRTDSQCLDRWTSSLDPAFRRGRWSADEDARLFAARASAEAALWLDVAEKVRTRNRKQCLQRWKILRARVSSHGGKEGVA